MSKRSLYPIFLGLISWSLLFAYCQGEKAESINTYSTPEPRYSAPKAFIRAMLGWRYGIINEEGAWIINPRYDYLGFFKEGLAAAGVGGEFDKKESLYRDSKWGFIDERGEWAVNPQFTGVLEGFQEGLAPVSVSENDEKGGNQNRQRWGFIDREGKWIIPPKYKAVGLFREGFARAQVDVQSAGTGGMRSPKWGLIDKSGNWAIPPNFDALGNFNNGLAPAGVGGTLTEYGDYRNTKHGFIDQSGKWTIPPQYYSIRSFDKDSAPVSMEPDKWGLIDRSGNWIVNPQFSAIDAFNDGIAAACIGGTRRFIDLEGAKWGFIDRVGRWVISPQFDKAEGFEGDFAWVSVLSPIASKNRQVDWEFDTWGLINRRGELEVTPIYRIQPQLVWGDAGKSFFAVIRGGTSIVIDNRGKTIFGEGTRSFEVPGMKSTSLGSGFYVSAEGHVITNSHVVHGAKEIKVSGNPAQLIVEDMSNDIALLKVTTKPASYATLSRKMNAKIGEEICTYGFPLTGILSEKGSLSVGTLNSLSGVGNNTAHFQVSVPIQPGNSGGPLINRKGQVIGIIVAKLDDAALATITGQLPQNVNFAINSVTLRAFLDINNVPYRTAGLVSRKISIEKIAVEAQKYAVKIECAR
jgi:hypothetical protein